MSERLEDLDPSLAAEVNHTIEVLDQALGRQPTKAGDRRMIGARHEEFDGYAWFPVEEMRQKRRREALALPETPGFRIGQLRSDSAHRIEAFDGNDWIPLEAPAIEPKTAQPTSEVFPQNPRFTTGKLRGIK